MTTSTWDEARALEHIRALQDLPGAALQILNALQEEFGYIDEAAIPLVADALNLSRAEVVGIAHFYHDYRHEPPARHVLKICRAESCQSMGCEALVEHVQSSLGSKLGQTTPDGALSLETVYCLGNCALSPAVMLDGRLHGRMTSEKVDGLVGQARSGA